MTVHEQVFKELGALFETRGHELFLVGGSVRDIALGRNPKDWDFTTTALPEEIKSIIGRPSQHGWADAVWTVGERFGTIAARKDGVEIEITTMRTDGPGRKPEVVWTTDLVEDLKRRDFTINAMAARCDADGLHAEITEIIDPFNGKTDLFLELLKTPDEPWKTFSEDPLRMLRAARFASQLGSKVGSTEEMAMSSNRELVKTVSAERIAAELEKTIAGANPRKGLFTLEWTGLLKLIAPHMESRNVHDADGDTEVRWALAFGGKGGFWVEQDLKALKMSTNHIRRIATLATMAVTWGEGIDWTHKRHVRELLAQVAKADPNDARGFLHKALAVIDDPLATSQAEAVLAEEGFPKAPLSGKEIMAHLAFKPGKEVGNAAGWLWGKALDEGPIDKERARALLDEWKELVSA